MRKPLRSARAVRTHKKTQKQVWNKRIQLTPSLSSGHTCSLLFQPPFATVRNWSALTSHRLWKEKKILTILISFPSSTTLSPQKSGFFSPFSSIRRFFPFRRRSAHFFPFPFPDEGVANLVFGVTSSFFCSQKCLPLIHYDYTRSSS